MEVKATDIILGILAILSFVFSFVSERYRTILLIFTFVLTIIIIISLQEYKISELKARYGRLEEKLKIHEQLIDIKKDIELLKEKRFKK